MCPAPPHRILSGAEKISDTRDIAISAAQWTPPAMELARSMEYAGRDSIIQLNANGPFFNRTSLLMQLEPGGVLARPGGNHILTVSRYNGDTPEAQITILLHELGHIIGRLPEDDDSWDGRSTRNTSEVSRHCKAETIAAAHNCSRGGK